MTTTRSPAEAYSQQAEAISNEGKPMRWMDTAARLAPLVGLGALGYAEHRAQRRAAQQFHDRLEENYAPLDARARREEHARRETEELNRINAEMQRQERAARTRQMIQEVQDARRATFAAGRPANHDWRVGMVAGAASAQGGRPPMTRYNRGPRQDERFEL